MARKPRQQPPEQRRIFQREQAGQPVLLAVAHDERRLQAGKVVGAAPEALERLAQLAGVRLVLGVVERDELAAAERQDEVQRLRLGARLAGRHGDDLELRQSGGGAARLGDGRRIVGLADQLDFDAAGRPVEARQGRDEALDHPRLLIERDEDRIDGQGAHLDIFALLGRGRGRQRRDDADGKTGG